jgi:hypothetical protein
VQSLERIVLLYTSSGQPEKAAEFQKKLDEAVGPVH